MTTTLGVHIGHDGGCAVSVDGEITVAIAEERLTRVKYANGWWLSLRYCLESSGLEMDDLDLIVLSNAGAPIEDGFTAGLERWATRLPRVVNVDHHVSHAVGAFCFSGFASALVFVADAGGNSGMTESAYLVDGSSIERIYASKPTRPRCKGLGPVYEAVTNFLGFTDQESGKTMALAAYGVVPDWPPLFRIDSALKIEGALDALHQWGVEEFGRRCGVPIGEIFPETTSSAAQNLAAYVQSELERTFEHVLMSLLEVHGSTNVVLSGGTALNCVNNAKLRKNLSGYGFFPFPASSDTGLAIGNALYGHWVHERIFPQPKDRSMRFGRPYTEPEIRLALERDPSTVPPGPIRHGDLRYETLEDPVDVASQLLADGYLVGWWQGRSESGPRALGGRSILANPRVSGIRDSLNRNVKRREWFRPFAPSLLTSEAGLFTDQGTSLPYMIEAPTVSKSSHDAFPECIHIDGTARIQTVDRGSGPFGQLLDRVRRVTGWSAVLNTSFNVGAPIVETPGDAVATFLRTNLDAMVIGQYLCHKETPFGEHARKDRGEARGP